MSTPRQKLTIFTPSCPHCESDDVFMDPDVSSNGWRHTCMMIFLLFGAGSLTMYMICGSCEKKFTSVKNSSQPIDD